ncbi:hypothetical protein ACFL17_09550, partial [Pseudomonadota bacterium]
GILSIKDQGNGAIAWAWAFNGLFTVGGSIAAVVLSIYLGFKFTILVGIACYILAYFMLHRIRGLRLS